MTSRALARGARSNRRIAFGSFRIQRWGSRVYRSAAPASCCSRGLWSRALISKATCVHNIAPAEVEIPRKQLPNEEISLEFLVDLTVISWSYTSCSLFSFFSCSKSFVVSIGGAINKRAFVRQMSETYRVRVANHSSPDVNTFKLVTTRIQDVTCPLPRGRRNDF